MTAKTRCGTVMILAKPHHKVQCEKWPKTALRTLLNKFQTDPKTIIVRS